MKKTRKKMKRAVKRWAFVEMVKTLIYQAFASVVGCIIIIILLNVFGYWEQFISFLK